MAYSITLRSADGTEEVIQCEEDQYILDAAEYAGIDLPSVAVLVLVVLVQVK